MDPHLAVSLFTLTLVGGPTVLIDVGGARFITDPTFDPAESSYVQGPVQMQKRAGPSLSAQEIGRVDAVLLSHDEHRDNLDEAGRRFLPRARQVLTTPAGAKRLGGRARGLRTWESVEVTSPQGTRVKVTAVPARHGPEGTEALLGEVTGFVLEVLDERRATLYVTGDTVWTEDLREIGRRFRIDAVLVFGGAAGFASLGDTRLTLNAVEAVRLVRTLGRPAVLSAHDVGWAHYAEGPDALARALEADGLGELYVQLKPGQPTQVTARGTAPQTAPAAAPARPRTETPTGNTRPGR